MFDDVHFSLMIATALIFLCLIYILNNMLFKPLLKFMDERDNNIAQNIAQMKQDTEEIQSYEEELGQIHIRAIEEADAIRDDIVERAKEKAQERLRKRQVELDLDMKRFRKDLSDEKTKAYEELEKKLNVFKQSYKETLKHI